MPFWCAQLLSNQRPLAPEADAPTELWAFTAVHACSRPTGLKIRQEARQILRPHFILRTVASGVFVYVGLILFLVPRHGPMGAALSVLGGYAALGVIITTLWARTLRGSRSEARPSEEIGGPERSAACSRRASQIGQDHPRSRS